MMSCDVVIDTVPCLPSRSSSRPRPVIISYRIPDDIETQSIICDTGYDDTSPIYRSYCFPPRFPPTVSPDGSGRGTTPSYTLHASPRLICLFISSPSHRVIRPARCLLAPLQHMRLIHLIHLTRLVPSYRFISRPALLPALLPAERPVRCLPISTPHPSIGSSHRNATSDKTSDELTETAHDMGNRQRGSGKPRHSTPPGYRKYPSPPAV